MHEIKEFQEFQEFHPIAGWLIRNEEMNVKDQVLQAATGWFVLETARGCVILQAFAHLPRRQTGYGGCHHHRP